MIKDQSVHYKSKDLKVAIFAQLLNGRAGGIEMNLLSLLKALNELESSGRQVIIGPGSESRWFEPHLGPRQTILPWPPISYTPMECPNWLPRYVWEAARRGLGRYRFKIAKIVRRLFGSEVRDHSNEGQRITCVLEEMGVQLLHFPYQICFPTALPSIYEPWDLQHRHFPEFFTTQEINFRDQIYLEGCQRATLIITASEWTKQDVIKQFGIDSKKIAVIRRSPLVSRKKKMTYQEAISNLRSLKLPDRFILYPAKTWPHKNHLRLFQALAILRDKHLLIPLICTGAPAGEHWYIVKKSVEELSLKKTVIFPGYLNEDQMASLFKIAEFLIFPSLFEGLGIPLLEAMNFGLPIITSKVTCLPEVAGDAALYFDPFSVDSIAEAIQKAWLQSSVLEECREKGAVRLKHFNWDEAARQFQACYRYALKQPLTIEDQTIMEEITNTE